MQTEIFENSEDLAIALAGHIMGILKEKPNATMVLTSGNTPIAAYRHIAKTASKDLFKHATIIGLDEWVGVSGESEGSCKYIVEENLLKPLGIPASQYTFFDSMTTDLQAECERVDELIFSKGGLDFILVGLGVNGHIGLNEPGSSFDSYCQVTDLEEITITIGQKYFNSATPLTQGITVGLKHLLEAKEAMVIATGKAKSDIVRQMSTEPVSEMLPATVLRKHFNGKLWIDKAAAKGLE
ncbi:MAG: glucosamine-6-phosphate deaminase [Cytophagaceae bacterium]|nr:glucosamine-6-phosphate deaminase [Cytophagaceae bacterium]MBK9935444.1 glucosamine-6-phosphate deaminase [Cytophagaceae bacterium]MBL0301886.1 glucosamine-6-phosphate deaminase [Cytophagaceae bacterium]MBL0324712.1 glucosamine-6-phosphate deaminase [Cytophagaceae bacterium]